MTRLASVVIVAVVAAYVTGVLRSDVVYFAAIGFGVVAIAVELRRSTRGVDQPYDGSEVLGALASTRARARTLSTPIRDPERLTR